jgi:hypothetical protein
LQGAVHPDDQQIFSSHPDHTFNLDFPPPAFIGDVDTAPIVVLMSNGGYKHGETEKEFPDLWNCAEHCDYLRGLRAALPPRLAGYYAKGRLGEWITEGSAVLVNAVPYRSPQLSKEKNNQLAPSIWLHWRCIVVGCLMKSYRRPRRASALFLSTEMGGGRFRAMNTRDRALCSPTPPKPSPIVVLQMETSSIWPGTGCASTIAA